MKKFFALAVAMVVALGASAQIQKGEKIVGANIGFGNSAYTVDGGFSNILIPITIEGEYGIAEDLFGVDGLSLGVGPQISYTKANIDYSKHFDGANVGVKNSDLIIAAKGYFHYNVVNVDKLDTYAALALGYDRLSSKNYGDWGGYEMVEGAGGDFFFGVSVGARYWFQENLAANLEAGYGLSWLKLGVNFKF